MFIINTGHHSTARAVEHHIHKAEEVLDHTVALHCIRIPEIEATEGLGVGTLEEVDPGDQVAIAGVLAEDTTDTVVEVAVQIGLNSRNQGQWADELYRIGFVCPGKQLGYYHLP